MALPARSVRLAVAKLQEDLLKSTMEDLDTEVSGVKEMAQAWAFGNVAAIEKMTLAALQEAPELYQRLLVERNHNWIPHVETCIKNERRLLHRRRRRPSGRTGRLAHVARRRRATKSLSNRCLGCWVPRCAQADRRADSASATTVRSQRFEIRPESARFVASGLISSPP